MQRLTSCSDDILQHLSETCLGKDEVHMQAYNNFDNLEAEIDQLKEDVSRLREEASSARDDSVQEAEQEAPEMPTSPSRSWLPIPSEQKELSTAARLQKLHEEYEQKQRQARLNPSSELPQAPPPSALDFPVLGSPTATMSSESNTPTDLRRPSYADAAISGLHQKSARPVAAIESPTASHGSPDGDSSVIVSPNEDSSPGAEKARQAPHFAQPTQSYARRTGETLRREAGLSPSKTIAEAPSPKSVKGKGPTMATEKRSAQRQQKRKSIPQDWVIESGVQQASPSSDTGIDSKSNAVSEQQVTSSNRDSGSNVRLRAKTSMSSPRGTAAAVAQVQQSPCLRKKISSYMSPTTATTQRTAATLSKKRKTRDDHTSPKKKAPGPDLSSSKQTKVHSSEPGAPASDTSSVQFILDRPIALAAVPASRTMSPVAQCLEEKQAERSVPFSPVFGSPQSPMRHPRKSRMVEHFSSPVRSMEKYSSKPMPTPDYSTLYSMPTVGKTATVRRTSNSQILRPILARLSAEGLARDRPISPNSPTASTADVSSGLNVARESLSSSPIISQDRPTALAHARPSGPLPSRRRSQSQRTDLSTDNHAEPTDGLATLPETQEPMSVAQVSPVSSLRANAREFTPMLQSAVADAPDSSSLGYEYEPQEAPPSFSVNDLTAYRSPEEWRNMSLEQKIMIHRLRALVGLTRAQYASGDGAFRYNSSHRVGNSSFGFASIDESGSPQFVQTGKLLRPELVAGKKIVHWSLEAADNVGTPVKFGRASAPSFDTSPHATISPTSDDTSPLKSPRSAPRRPWSIDSAALNPMTYGWTGGDGKEIRFVGYGPHAERNPNSAVNFGFQDRDPSNSTIALPSRPSRMAMYPGENKENENTTGIVAPRTQKQWAEKLGFSKVPCDTMLITEATEMTPFAAHAAGYCYDCAAGR